LYFAAGKEFSFLNEFLPAAVFQVGKNFGRK
jgi:hypothetical protein